jgi:ABC-type enterobactin transport system permease subunit
MAMTRLARAFWIVVVGMLLCLVGPLVQNVLRDHLGIDLNVLRQGVPLTILIGLAILACGIVQVALAAWRELR